MHVTLSTLSRICSFEKSPNFHIFKANSTEEIKEFSDIKYQAIQIRTSINNTFTFRSKGSPTISLSIIVKEWQEAKPKVNLLKGIESTSLTAALNLLSSMGTTHKRSKPSSVNVPVCKYTKYLMLIIVTKRYFYLIKTNTVDRTRNINTSWRYTINFLFLQSYLSIKSTDSHSRWQSRRNCNCYKIQCFECNFSSTFSL